MPSAWRGVALVGAAVSLYGPTASAVVPLPQHSSPVRNAIEQIAHTACSIPHFGPGGLTLAEFHANFKGRTPVVFTRPLAQTKSVRDATLREPWLARYGNLSVILASANSFSHEKRPSTAWEYVRDFVHDQRPETRANETFYLFGDTLGAEWAGLTAAYPMPLDAASDDGLRVWGVGGRGSGVPFHTHGAAWAEVIHGRKRWWLSPPDVRPTFHGDESMLAWALRRRDSGDGFACSQESNRTGYAAVEALALDGASGPLLVGRSHGNEDSQHHIRFQSVHGGSACDDDVDAGKHSRTQATFSDAEMEEDGLLSCTIGPGDVLYSPPQWWHATLNLDRWTFFVSTFTQEREQQ